MRTIIFSTLFTALCVSVSAQQLNELTVEKIMRDPKWIGTSPSAIRWAHDSKTIYFNWNPEKTPGDSLYKITLQSRTPQKVSKAERLALPSVFGTYNRASTKMVYEKNGDIFLFDIPTNKTTQITNTVGRESGPYFSGDERKVIFTYEQNLYAWETSTGNFTQITNLMRGRKSSSPSLPENEKWVKQDQLANIYVLKERKEKRDATQRNQKAEQPKRPKEIFTEDKMPGQLRISPDGKFVTYVLTKNANAKNAIVPNYVTESGYTEDINARSKVGAPQNTSEFFVYDIARDTVLQVKTEDVPGIMDQPAYLSEYRKDDGKEKKPQARAVSFFGPIWSDDGKFALIQLRSGDNKDRWIMLLDVATPKLTLIDRQHDDAWIGGPGTGGFFAGSSIGWLADNKTVWFHSEESGYSHLYTADVTTGKKQALTTGNYEVQSAQLSRDKKFFYLTTNEVHAGEKHFYRMPVAGGKAERLTSLTGSNEVTLSPDEKTMAIRYSYSNKPWELYLQESKPGAKPQQITNSLTEEFKSYAWRDPIVTTFKARDGADVYTRLYKPANPNGAAVIFVHGAGYLQNAHKWWSSYFREYMFHNLLADKGYTVIDIDYRASAGYGRDWRTGIYQFMGGQDLTDHVDGAEWLVKEHGIDPRRIGIYGGSYGGFITLMGMFTTPGVFAAGAALRPVTDWAHYNHPYTSNILNLPYTDSLAYAKSSPIYHAEGLQGALLICHGMIDVNVHFQDVVRLSQRLIELGKDNWELAVYPLEDHGFVEPSSWTDEYKRILRLFEDNLKK